MIEAENIAKTFLGAGGERVEALRGVSLSVATGELFGLIGPDGGGKTTFLRVLANLTDADSGSAFIDGVDCFKSPAKLRGKLGYMPGKFSLYKDLSVEENLRFFASIFKADADANRPLIEEIYSSLEPFKDRLAGRLSGGMKQKLALCCALVINPKVLLLDEPTTGVDPVYRKEFWGSLMRLKKAGMTVLVSTPYMEEAALCDKIAFISSGKFLRSGAPEELSKSFGKTIAKASAPDMFALLAELRGCPFVEYAHSFGDSCHAVLRAGFDLRNLREYLKDSAGARVEESTASVEDAFIDLTV